MALPHVRRFGITLVEYEQPDGTYRYELQVNGEGALGVSQLPEQAQPAAALRMILDTQEAV